MTDEPVPWGNEQARAVQRASEFGITVVQAGQQLAGYVGRILGTVPEDAVGVVLGDPLHLVRTIIAAKYDEILTKILGDRGVKVTQPVSPALAIPLLRAAYDENRAELQDIWARLIAAAMDPKRAGRVRLRFIETAKQFDPLDALVLAKIFDTQAQMSPTPRDYVATFLKITPDEAELSFVNLNTLNCISYGGPHVSGVPLTVFGRELMRAIRD
jgi:hypothetical protein